MKLTYNDLLSLDVSGKTLTAHIEDLLVFCPELPGVCELAIAALVQAQVKKEIKKAKLSPLQTAVMFIADPKVEKVRPYLHYVHSDGVKLRGCCGAAYIEVSCSEFPKGVYTKLGAVVTSGDYKLPSFEKVLKQIKEVAAVPLSDAVILDSKYVKIGEVAIAVKYYKILHRLGVVEVYPQPEELLITFKADNYFGIIMGIRGI